MRTSDYRGSNMIFVAGCPRSGTTWLQRLLSCHPKICTGQETHIFDQFFMPVHQAWHRSADGSPRKLGLAGYFSEAEFQTVLKSFLTSLLHPLVAPLEPGQFFLEKTPSNALHVRAIVEALPDCRIIHVLRDPRDVVASLLAASNSWGKRWAPRNVRRAIRTWKKHVGQIHEASLVLPPWQYMEMRYEELYADPKHVLQTCAAFLGLEWSQVDLTRAILENTPARAVMENGGSHISVGGELGARFGATVKEPSGFVRKAQIGSWKTDLTVPDKIWIWARARKQMAANGYAWPSVLERLQCKLTSGLLVERPPARPRVARRSWIAGGLAALAAVALLWVRLT